MRPPRFLRSRDFWFAISLAALAAVSMWLYASNRALIREHEETLAYLCDTTTALDISVVNPLLVEVRETIKNLPPGEGRTDLMRLRDNLRIAHEELSTTRACEGAR